MTTFRTLVFTTTALLVVGLWTPLHAATVINFGSLHLTGDDGNGIRDTPAGWDTNVPNFDGSSGGGPDGSNFFLSNNLSAYATGTSDGDAIAAGDYDITFKYRLYGSETLQVTVYAWDGSTQTLLGQSSFSGTTTWQVGDSVAFTVASGSGVIGQDLQIDFRQTANPSYTQFDTISGTFTAVPEPRAALLIGLGALLLLMRRRRCE